MRRHCKSQSETLLTALLRSGTAEAPKHRAGHEHDWKLMAEFTGRRAAIYQCSDSTCEQTRTVWRIEANA